jgi:glycosyltransferase involved in cell wall biosynthesis
MKVLQVIHGYPMRYNAGSEVYTQTLSHGLAERHHVEVFTREENAFAPDYAMHQETDADCQEITLHVVNNPRSRDRYRDRGVDQRFSQVLDKFQPDIVHIGHLNHLSTSLVEEAVQRGIPVVYTLHDYWLMCPRGQFMQMHPEDPYNLWAACDGQEDEKCAERCYARYFSGATEEWEKDKAHWRDWVARRMAHVRAISEKIDLFIAPSRYLHDRYRDQFGLPERKLRYLDYGFDLERLHGRKRVAGEPFTFGYIGTHIPAKGIHQLIEAFGNIKGEACLRIWGRHRGQDSDALHALAKALSPEKARQVEWRSEYRNQEIVPDVFNHVDAIVVPSVWVENSPLVIHEALQARVPVITADTGGMAEYVHHEVNGLCFNHRDARAMAAQMQRLVDDPAMAGRLGQRGYVQSESGDIPGLDSQVFAVEEIYREVLANGNH